jgi:uncharacterized protein
MTEYRVRIVCGSLERMATLADTPTARAIWEALPIESRANRWGDEIYFSAPVALSEAEGSQEVVEVGDLAYWPPGHAVCIFWGPTPASHAAEPRAASPVSVFGTLDGDARDFGVVRSGSTIRLERA